MSDQVVASSEDQEQDQPTLEELRAQAAVLGEQISAHLAGLRGDDDDD